MTGRRIPSSRVVLALVCGLTVGPGRLPGAGGGGCEGAFVVLEGVGVACEAADGREGYLRAAAPAVCFAAFEAEEPIG